MRRFLTAVAGIALLVLPAAAQHKYLDLTTIQVKPDRAKDFEALCKRIADANRRHKGDIFLATEQVYGQGFTYRFGSPRDSYADIDQGMGKFMSAMKEELGPEGMKKFWQQIGDTIVSMQGEVWLSRPELSANAPSDPEGFAKMYGNARWIRTMRIRVAPGRGPDYERQLKIIAGAIGSKTKVPFLVSSWHLGTKAGYYMMAMFASSLADFDAVPPLPELLGKDAFEDYLKEVRDTLTESDSMMSRIHPELSAVPEAVTAVAPDFWTPKPAMTAAKPKAKPMPRTQ